MENKDPEVLKKFEQIVRGEEKAGEVRDVDTTSGAIKSDYSFVLVGLYKMCTFSVCSR